MFKEKSIHACGPAAACGLELNCIWDVHADASYDVPVARARRVSQSLRQQGGTGLIAVRTLEGKGRVYLNNDEVLELKDGTLVLLEWEKLRRYHCMGKVWHFWWFEFFAFGPLNIPLYEDIVVSSTVNDREQVDEIQKAFRSRSHIRRCAASARFLVLLYEWLQQYRNKIKSPQECRIESIINRMYGNLADKWSVSDMAKEAGMSEAWFRKEFHRVTGSSPKKFVDRLRLAWADELLRTTTLSVSELAYKLGFSSPFHFSKAFRHAFGCPPSSIRKGR